MEGTGIAVYAARGQDGKTLSRPLLRAALRGAWGLHDCPPLTKGPWGKPEFAALPGRHFNLSHSGPFALCALDGDPVGADIQVARAVRPGLPDRVCSARERDWLRRRGDAPLAFALLWAMKESRCKRDGKGLTLPISAIAGIAVPLPEEKAGATPLALPFDDLIFTLFGGEGWQTSICGARGAQPIRWLEIQALTQEICTRNFSTER